MLLRRLPYLLLSLAVLAAPHSATAQNASSSSNPLPIAAGSSSRASSASIPACDGTPILVTYPYDGYANDPFECQPYCSNRQEVPRYIIYSNGVGTPCGVQECKDEGEDTCKFCRVPDGYLNTLQLPEPDYATIQCFRGQRRPVAVCGNKTVDVGEQCDDGNVSNNDGCSSACSSEPPRDLALRLGSSSAPIVQAPPADRGQIPPVQPLPSTPTLESDTIPAMPRDDVAETGPAEILGAVVALSAASVLLGIHRKRVRRSPPERRE